jgi:hypothetical protein
MKKRRARDHRLAGKIRAAVKEWYARQTPELRRKGFARIVTRALVDENYKARLLANAEHALREEKMKAPKGTGRVRVVENTPGTTWLVLPRVNGAAAGRVSLRDRQLMTGLLGLFFDDDLDWWADRKTGDRRDLRRRHDRDPRRERDYEDRRDRDVDPFGDRKADSDRDKVDPDSRDG